MGAFTIFLVGIAAFQEGLAYQPLTKPSEGDYKNESYFGQENDPYDEDIVMVPSAPPTPILEQPSVAPDASYVWVPGYWKWRDEWEWESGSWVRPPYQGATWQAGYWEKRPEGWVWRKGRWKT